MRTARKEQRFCGREFSAEEVLLIEEVVETCAGISRAELAHTVCELLEWKRAGGGLKARECRDLLERLESVAPAGERQVPSELTGSVEEFAPIKVELVQSREQRELFRELLSFHHYLGYTMPYGARLQYLAYVSRPRRIVVGCMQFSSPAWRMKVRDQWIGWDDVTRGVNLQHVVNNSRFLVLGKIRNLASTLISCVLRQLRTDWQDRYGVDPWLVETLVERERFYGGCYRAANFIVLGETSGRGRMDRTHQRHGVALKTVMVYPLLKGALCRLRDGCGG
jgi:hypothetical protein